MSVGMVDSSVGTVESNSAWSLAPKAARILGGIAPRQVARLAQRGLITVLKLPGCEPRYLLSDVEKLAQEFTEAASAEAVVVERAAKLARRQRAAISGREEETRVLNLT